MIELPAALGTCMIALAVWLWAITMLAIALVTVVGSQAIRQRRRRTARRAQATSDDRVMDLDLRLWEHELEATDGR